MIDLSTHIIELETQGHTHIIDIIHKVQEMLSKEGYEEGQVLIAATGSTAGITTLEYAVSCSQSTGSSGPFEGVRSLADWSFGY